MEDLLYQIARLIVKLQQLRCVVSCKERQIGQKTEESLETDPQIYGYLIYDKGDTAGQWKMNNFLITDVGSIRVKWIVNLSGKGKTKMFPED